MTTINFNLVHAFCRTLEPGDEIVITALDHDANVSPWLLCAKDHGLVVRTADVREGDLQVEPAALEAVVGPRTKVCAFTLASNAVGTMPDARALADIAHSVGALAWMDCVHYAPHRRIDVKALGADVLLCSPYKFFGPHQGLGFAREELLASWPADRVRPAGELPAGHRFETGTMSHEALAGVKAAIDFVASLGEGADRRAKLDAAFRDIVAYETALTARMLDGLAEVPGMTLYGITDPARAGERTPTFTFTLPGITPAPGLRAAGRARHPRLGRQLLRARHHGSPRPRRPRRSDPPRLPPLHHRGRGRSHARGRRRDRARLSRRPQGRAMLLLPRGCGGTGRRARFRSVWP